METNANPGSPTSRWKRVLASFFTPSLGLGLLLFFCLFLPFCEGCNHKIIRVCDTLTEGEMVPGVVYVKFVVAFPFLLGLVIFLGTLVLVASLNPERARFLWWCFAVLIVINAVLLVTALIFDNEHSVVLLVQAAILRDSPEKLENSWTQVWFATVWYGATVLLIALLPITYRCCADWFNAAMWLQLAMTLTAALCLSFVVPAVFFAQQLLIGGKLAIASCVFLLPISMVQRLDGRRALDRMSAGENSFQLSLKSMLCLMLLSGLACAWVAPFVVDGIQTAGDSNVGSRVQPQEALETAP